MKRLQFFNLLGVLVLAVLCVVQWQINRRLNLETNRLDRIRQERENKLAEQERAAKGISADLETFRAQFARANEEARDAARKLVAAERAVTQLERERDQLQASVTNWAAAVAERDARLAEANARIKKLSEELNMGVRRFNELVTNHNTAITKFNELAERHEKLVKDWNAQQAKLAGEKPPPGRANP